MNIEFKSTADTERLMQQMLAWLTKRIVETAEQYGGMEELSKILGVDVEKAHKRGRFSDMQRVVKKIESKKDF